MIARRVVVSGQVQGVFFRDSTQRAAGDRGVHGWVRNRDDGTVEIWLEGDEGPVEAVIQWCRSGPSQAEVEQVDVDEVDPEGLEGFEVR